MLGLEHLFDNPDKPAAAGLTVLLSLILITPLCGYLFQCGCDWPWAGLDKHCNYFREAAAHRCPWCVLLPAGVLSAGIAIVAGALMASLSLAFYADRPLAKSVLQRTLLGLLVFFGIAVIAAWVAADWQNYPLLQKPN